MNRIDKRTGEEFPSLVRDDAIAALFKLGGARNVSLANELKGQADWRDGDGPNNWTLDLDPASLRQYGAFMDRFILPSEARPDDPDEQLRPMEWYERVGALIHEEMTCNNYLWEVINNIFDEAIKEADQELGFAVAESGAQDSSERGS